MSDLELYFKILVGIQFLHSIEEICTRFAKRWPIWRMSQKTFVLLEIFFAFLVLSMVLIKTLPYRDIFMAIYSILMFANGVWHLMWAGIEKRYVPGLITAPFFLIVYLIFYFRLLF